MEYLKKRHGMTMIGATPPGTCPECAIAHAADQPHNRDSLCYQFKFYDAHGSWPTWEDAMAHCPDEVRAAWTEELKKHGVAIGQVTE